MLSFNEIKEMNGDALGFEESKNLAPQHKARFLKNREAQLKSLWFNEEIMSHRSGFEKKFGFDYADSKKFPVMESGFSWNKVAKKFGHSSARQALREADSASSFPQVLRAGVQALVNKMYNTVPVTYEQWTSTVSSNKDTELYAPLQGLSFLREVGKQELYSESRAAGLDIKLVNRKYGTVYSIEKELLDDDQTGQFSQQVGLLGEYAKQAFEVIAYAKLAGKFTGGALAQYSQMTVPNTETQPANESNYPFTTSSAPFIGGGYNKPSSFAVLGQTVIQNGFIALMNQLNILELKMSVDPDTIMISPRYRFDAAVLLNSSWYPTQPGTTLGNIGNLGAINPIQSIAKLVVSRFMFDNTGTVNANSAAWYLCDSKVPFFVMQLRQGAEVIEEAPNSGESFNRDIMRFKVSVRGNGDYIDPRFIWQGNDGSVTS